MVHNKAITILMLSVFGLCTTAGNAAETETTQTVPVSQAESGPVKTCMTCYEEQALTKLLGQYKELAANGGWPEWNQGKPIRKDASDPRIPTLRQILTITGDYPAASGVDSTSTQYDSVLVEAVNHFQARHGLNVSAEVTKSTQAALAIPVEKRITQIMATLERIHENQLAPESKFVLVNLPGYTLYAVDNGKQALTMRVIVGNRQNHTPLFDNEINAVVFNPPWSVPVRIARNELIPKLRKNPSYFVNAGFIVTQDGTEVDPMSANADDGNFSFRQRPGTGNALGKIKFNIPDTYDVYLHSTATPKLFANEDRALSHGCVRLEKPRELAHFVMGGEEGWNDNKIDHAYDSTTQKNVKVTTVPVHLVYWTAFVDSDGSPHFYGDMYNMDKPLTSAMLDSSKTITLASK